MTLAIIVAVVWTLGGLLALAFFRGAFGSKGEPTAQEIAEYDASWEPVQRMSSDER